MKTIFYNIILLTLFITSQSVLAQNDSNQFEKAQNEILNLINLPNPTFDPSISQESMTAKAIDDLGFEQTIHDQNTLIFFFSLLFNNRVGERTSCYS